MSNVRASEGLVSRYEAGRARTELLFSLLSDDAFWERPIPLRHPIVFYRGHLAAFNVNTVLKRGLGEAGIRPDFELLFERGIDPADQAAAEKVSIGLWPSRPEIEDYVVQADARVRRALERIEGGEGPAGLSLQAAWTSIEHELMHQETLLYIFHRLPLARKRRPRDLPEPRFGAARPQEFRNVPAGTATLGALPGEIPFGWDNEFPKLKVDVGAFEIARDDTANGEFLEFVEAGGYRDQKFWREEDWSWIVRERIESPLFWEKTSRGWIWRGMFDEHPLPAAWPVYVSLAEARAFARWKGMRLATEAEFHRAAYGAPAGEERPFPWGEEPPDSSRGNFDFRRYDPVAVGSYPRGASAWGVEDLLGNGWEWTDTPWAGFPGFSPMETYPRYSADFFDGKHFVIKGGSSATDAAFLRRSFRNWFQPHYQYLYATFRCVRAGS
jgi:ergothioneine biosynthesis protein EgtB